MASEADSHNRGMTLTSTDIAILRPSAIFEMAARDSPMPTQVLLQACDTSALSDAGSGEWLTIAPAFIATGCREVIATLYPILDQNDTEDALMSAAINGTSLCDAMRSQQRKGLTIWNSGLASRAAHTPLSWAAYAPICVLPAGTPQTTKSNAPLEVMSERCLSLVANATQDCRRARAHRLDTGYVLASYLEFSGIADDFDGGDLNLRPSSFIWKLGPHFLSRFLPFRDPDPEPVRLPDGAQIRVSPLLIRALREARSDADLDGTLVQPEHIMRRLLTQPCAARRILTIVSHITRRPPELALRAIEDSMAHELAKPVRPVSTSSIVLPTERERRILREKREFALAIAELALLPDDAQLSH